MRNCRDLLEAGVDRFIGDTLRGWEFLSASRSMKVVIGADTILLRAFCSLETNIVRYASRKSSCRSSDADTGIHIGNTGRYFEEITSASLLRARCTEAYGDSRFDGLEYIMKLSLEGGGQTAATFGGYGGHGP
ncbi:unnamed protein product [Zymoseptoria tritici ST99CH_1A5]|uniref:Uncharacterized protein n=2 Tax=Zymoseptoria tritici TaxID=1047171 RepID=A0A2H1GI23_ZYMTR|nr:unnamed protein product [Zymoseptoria tritici ST99CH_1E4]SMY24965.1 unnamed protein product [Zymoseptoria tritici ST99CH_1A5]